MKTLLTILILSISALAQSKLIYHSEIDAPVLPFEARSFAGKLTVGQMHLATGETRPVQIRDYNEFIERLTENPQWEELRHSMEGLQDKKVFRFGDNFGTYYIVGKQGRFIVGVRFEVLET